MGVRHLRRSSFRFAAKRQSEAHRFCASGGRFRQRGADRKKSARRGICVGPDMAGCRGGEKVPGHPPPIKSRGIADLGPPFLVLRPGASGARKTIAAAETGALCYDDQTFLERSEE